MRETAVIIPLVPVRAGETWSEGTLPLHLTTLPNVRIAQAGLSELNTTIAEITATTPPLTLVAVGRARFGPGHDVPVTTVARDPALSSLHERLLAAATAAGATPLEPAYMGAGWRPHITRTHTGAEITPGSEVAGTCLVVVDCTASTRVVTHVFDLAG